MPFGKLGVPELLIILAIILLIFGAGKLPEVGNAIGKSLKAFRESQKSEDKKKEDEPKPKSDSAEAKEVKK